MAVDRNPPVARRIRNIAELAELAGVSSGTVSRALSGAGLISTKTRERIQALARDHGFTPNAMARNLRIRRTGAIGVAVPLGHETGRYFSDAFLATMLSHLADGLTERGYDLMLSRIIPEDDTWLDRIVDSGRVDGVIVVGRTDQSDMLDRVAARYRPLVVWDGQSGVGQDIAEGVGHLVDLLLRRIAGEATEAAVIS